MISKRFFWLGWLFSILFICLAFYFLLQIEESEAIFDAFTLFGISAVLFGIFQLALVRKFFRIISESYKDNNKEKNKWEIMVVAFGIVGQLFFFIKLKKLGKVID